MTREDPAINVFFSYSHKDEVLRDALEEHLALLKRKGLLKTWHDREIGAGDEWADQIDEQLETADLVLLLISPSFIASDYCYDREMGRALERHDAGEAKVVPVILRPCDWHGAPFGKLQALPKDGEPITRWANRDDAFLDVARGLRRLIKSLDPSQSPRPAPPAPTSPPPEPTFANDETRELSKALKATYRQRAETLAGGGDITELNETIVGIKRQLRAGPQLQAGDHLLDDRFELLELIGQGGFATVWRAYDHKQESLVAVKVLHSQYSHDKGRRDRFFRGARHMAKLRHAGIAAVIEPECEDGGYYFFAMEYVAGGDFRDAVLGGKQSTAERLDVVLRVGEALGHAHAQGVVHRDVKPANILLDLDGRPKLTDFDLVRAADSTGGTRTAMLGTFLYAAPEAMIDGKQASKPADVYGLGMTAVFALHGAKLPGDALWELPELVGGLDASEACRSTLARAVARKVEQRWDSVESFCAALRAALTPPESQRPASRKRPPSSTTLATPDGETGKAKPALPSLDSRLTIFTVEGSKGVPIQARIARAEALGREGDPRFGPERFEENLLAVPGQHWSLGKYQVTVVEYERFVAAQGYEDPQWWSEGGWAQKGKSGWSEPGSWKQQLKTPNRPVVTVSWWEAEAYCRWRSGQLDRDIRLPKEAEWKLAATHPEVKYPWGAEKPNEELANFGKNVGRPTPVGLYPRGNGLYGHCDLAGNVWEWCLDELEGGKWRPLRGGSWWLGSDDLRSALRLRDWPGHRRDDFGFRLLWCPPSSGSASD